MYTTNEAEHACAHTSSSFYPRLCWFNLIIKRPPLRCNFAVVPRNPGSSRASIARGIALFDQSAPSLRSSDPSARRLPLTSLILKTYLLDARTSPGG
jgi:hypothetical protein